MIALLSSLAPVFTHAQSRGYDVVVSAGAATRTGALWESDGVAPLVRVGVQNRSASPLHYRLDAEVFRKTADRSVGGVSTREDGTSASALYSAMLVAPTDNWSPYALAGVGVQVVSSRATGGWPWLFGTARIGAGLRGQLRGVRLSAEVATVRALREPGTSRFVPVTVGVLF